MMDGIVLVWAAGESLNVDWDVQMYRVENIGKLKSSLPELSIGGDVRLA